MSSLTTTIDEVLHHLLMEEAQVCLPGLGTLRRTARPAQLSPFEKQATPPSQLVAFNANLVLDDGRLLRELQEAYGVEATEATVLLEGFLSNMRENLDAGRTFSIDGVGRFFKPFDGQIQFTQAGQNFSKASFGLPAVELVPIKRTEKQRRAAVDPMLVGADPRQSTGRKRAGATPSGGAAVKQRRHWFRRPNAAASNDEESLLYNEQLRSILWYVAIGLGILLTLMLVYKLSQSYASSKVKADVSTPRTERPLRRVPEDRINVAPAPVNAKTVAPDDPPRLNEARRDRTQDSPVATTPTPPTTNAPQTSAPEIIAARLALIGIGKFGSQRNVQKNMDRIRAAGFKAFARPDGSLTRVGAELEYEKDEELQAALERLQRIYPEAFVME